MRVQLPRPNALLFALALAIFSGVGNRLLAQRTTLVVFAERPLSDDQWGAVSAAMQREIADEPQISAGADLLRGESIVHGSKASDPISVYLHGDCALNAIPQARPSGALGWVHSVQGRIEPFIHVDCAKIAQELTPLALGMDRCRRNVVMGEAIARVIAHEWIHIATQSAGHAKDGVAKSWFGILDLLAEDDQLRDDPRLVKARWRQLQPGL